MSRAAALLNAFAAVVWCVVPAAAVPPSVPGFARLQQAGAGASAEAGEVLLSELSCLACHRDESKLPPALTWKAGPNLATAGDRLRVEYLRRFLDDPATTKPGTTMPDLLAGQPEVQRAELADNLTHFLSQMRAPEKAAAPPAGSMENGKELFFNVGCVACHGVHPPPRLAEKYAPGELARFLQDPLGARPDGRMPHLHLTAQEAADIAAFIAPEPPASKAQFVLDPAKAADGARAFQSLGCIACHGGVSTAKPLAALQPQGGCLAEKAGGGVPHYPLSAEQRTALRAALQARGQAPRAEEPMALARQLMLQRNCFACHARGGLGGPAPEIAEHFTSTRDDLGDLGRLPPPLDGVGRKLQPAALENILRGQHRVRAYMRVRMPDFGPELAECLGALFARTDADPNEKPALAKSDPNKVGRNEAGRVIVGTSGYACISCHELHGHASLGIGAYDLAEMPKRLRPEWVRDFLLNPAAFPTGTRMPAFWPNGKPMNPKLGGDAERQIDSVRVYLSEVDQSLPPEGFIDHAAYELKPAERPIIFRTFVEGAGAHAIAVGFPQGVNAAFDALRVRWALAWRGRFLDADGTWHQRAAKVEKPLGEQIVSLMNAGELGLIGRAEAKPAYRGYRVGSDGVPTFLYDLGALRVEDRLDATTSRNLRRTLRVSGQTTEAVEFRAQPPAGLTVRVAGHAPPSPLEFKNGTAEIVEEITW